VLKLSEEQILAIRREAESVYPHECCGFLLGIVENGLRTVRKLVPAKNRRTDDPRRYLIDPDQFQRIESQVREDSLEILGFFHSHPDAPARPSEFDRDHAWPWYSYLIISVIRGRAGDWASWQLLDDRSSFQQEETSSR